MLKALFKKEKADELGFQGHCHDCGKEIEVVAKLNGDKVDMYNGAVYLLPTEMGNRSKTFLKCADCYKKNPTLTNFRETEVYSRVVGYLRPVKQYNKGKQEEFRERKVFSLKGVK